MIHDGSQPSAVPPDVRAWSDLVVEDRIEGGHRNDVWRGRLDGEAVAVRVSRRSADSLGWELDLIDRLDSLGFVVPVVVPTDDGSPSIGGVVVQRWIDGREPSSSHDWTLVAGELQRLHHAMDGHLQRPGCVPVAELGRLDRSVDADLAALPNDVCSELLDVFSSVRHRPTTVIHGDPAPSNLRITLDGRVGLLDWDESRVDVALHDLSNLGVQVLSDADHARAERLSDAWETANAWTVEPEYARQRLDRLRRSATR